MQAFAGPLRELAEFDTIRKNAAAQPGMIQVTGCVTSQKTHFLYALGEGCKRKVIVAASELRVKQIYEEYKEAQGYSKLEIAKKKEALNSVLIPLSAKDNEKLCFEAGFSAFECIFRWGNFATFVAIKK